MTTLAQISRLRKQVEAVEKNRNKNRRWKWKTVPVSEEERIWRLNHIKEVLGQKYADEKLLAASIIENDPDVDVRVIQDFLDVRELSIKKLSTITLADIPAVDEGWQFPKVTPPKRTPQEERESQEITRRMNEALEQFECERLEKNPRYKSQLPFLPSPKFPFPSNRFLIKLSHLDESNDSATETELIYGRGTGWCELERRADKRYHLLSEEESQRHFVLVPLETVNNCHDVKSVPEPPPSNELDKFEAWLGEDDED
ncbi:MAG: hypothetical protein N4J56_002846 [Chroococcidiopsis sp. SAG 2025]|uniref:hypothetical protein n=1 Tax=Chroococcidiopsis sp. SAG 2025 TaxID=171389 RepID=UPI0029371C4E|nr:hypothetical protein [Chroococcidiopsis sp. SAG 2025]MDV2993192.1 hypothetical protein [Chroococcidiopsis sp. SAG 2025]